MPCATTHLLLAGRVLRESGEGGGGPPLRFHVPEVRRAFLHGALAPDMGFVPGVDRFVSELAHYHSPADLTRALFRVAQDPADEAFAWGWASHVLGDVEIHPLVGRAVGEHLHGDRGVRIDARADVATHVSMEVGLDIVVLLRNPWVPAPPPSLHFDGRRIARFAGALEEVYGIPWDPRELLGQHRRAVRLTRRWPAALRVLGAAGLQGAERDRPWPGRPLLASLLGVARRAAAPGSAARGFLRPRQPPEWVVAEVERAVAAFPRRLRRVAAGGAESLENRNLETGEAAGAGRGHPASDLVARRLTEARGRAPAPSL